MERLYDNLDNYEDENIVAELRRENGELKYKLDEYTVAMEKLQKDFDKLTSEFKKLEMNYSSLLKTAKEEIQRKTLIINNLNLEKDMMVLKAIQNKNVPNLRKTGKFTPHSRSSDRSNDVNKTKTPNSEKGKTSEKTQNERNKITPSSEETTTSASTEVVTQNASEIVDRLRNTYQDVKENKESNVCRPKPMSISNRRKSMPAIRSDIRFSSDEDEDSYRTAVNTYQNTNYNVKPQSMLKSLHDKNRLLDERHRTSETSSIEDKYSNYRESRNKYRTRSSRYDSYRNRDKFDSQRSKRHGSTERLRKSARNYSNEHSSREDYNRHKLLVSPPPERHRSNQRRSRDGRSRYDSKEYSHKERNKDSSQDNYSGKHKLQHSDEPLCKRRRNDSTHIREGEQGWDPIRGSIQITASVENISDMYCQSPDYLAVQDTAAILPLEIKNTAVCPQEDPRLQKENYVSRQGDAGRIIELKIIDTSYWDIERVEMPKALTRRPSQSSEDIARNIYMDIENPVSNMSLESGEIQTDDLDVLGVEQPMPFKVNEHMQEEKSNAPSKNFIVHVEKQPIEDFRNYRIPKMGKEHEKLPMIENRNYTIPQIANEPEHNYPLNNNNRKADKQIGNKTLTETCSANIPKQKSDPLVHNIMQEIGSVSIPQHQSSPPVRDNVQSKEEFTKKSVSIPQHQSAPPVRDNVQSKEEFTKKSVSIPQHQSALPVHDNVQSKEEFTKNSISIPQHKSVPPVHDNMQSKEEFNKKNNSNNGFTPRVELNSEENGQEHLKQAKRAVIEGDLELSDETNDYIDVKKKFTPENKITTGKNVFKSNKVDSTPVETLKDSRENSDLSVKENTKSSKSKRKSQKASNKETSKKEKTEITAEKRTRTKRDKKEAKEIKEKFSELFGDTTSSLITPEDLGIPALRVESKTSDKYIPICEDAQDVVLTKPVESECSTTSLPILISCGEDDKPVENKDDSGEIVYEDDNIQINYAKKKKSKKNEVVQRVSSTVDENHPKPAHEDHARTSDRLNMDQSAVEISVVTKTVENVQPLKPDLLKALATSTPYKEIKENPVAVDILPPNTNCTDKVKHDTAVSVDDTATDQSTNETCDSQTEVDAPDVRIFVRRKRKVVRKSKP